jgi:hypothetical protein
MDQLRLRMDVLRMLARQPASADRQHLAEREINQYLPDEVGDGKVSLERLSKAIDEEAKRRRLDGDEGIHSVVFS